MNINKSQRMNYFQQSIFSELLKRKNSKLSEGVDMIDLSIGSPDTPPPLFVTRMISDLANDPMMYQYTLKGTVEFHKVVTENYLVNYGVRMNEDTQVALLMGSQDGLVHLPLVLCDPGDYVLVPDPGYTAYEAGCNLAGAIKYPMPLKKENGFLPDLSLVPEDVCQKAKLMIISYPGNPVPVMATEGFFKEAIAFAKKYDIVLLHDFAYSELYFEKKPISLLSVEGGMEVGIEMNSLSKSFSMAGCRVAYAAGNEQVIGLLSSLKSNLDYGVFHPFQMAAAKALLDHSDFLKDMRSSLRNRRDLLLSSFADIGWHIDPPEGSMFIWAEIPKGNTSLEFAFELLERAHVVVTPGSAFGEHGEGYVRIAMVQPENVLIKAVQQIKNSGILSVKA
ncbi:LL-diaminopimelate aminotransferase [Cytobacillus gottheilii]|uniref:LL-diaminopimelate aminotransferase n=1 Tax=Cytobacillus gottheilii TaxID=859144 RepID=UPI0009BB386F|nr:LL-diaminopimelate aminotransferase [Cytobacillus gottheilii]